MKKIGLCVCLLLVTAIQVIADEQDKAIETITKVANELKTMQCDFVQTKHMSILNEKVVSQGKMYYQASDKLRWEYMKPYQYSFILNGQQVQIIKGDQSDIINVDQNKVFKEIVRIMMNSVVGKCLNDKRDFVTTIQTTDTEWVAHMEPQRGNMKNMFKQIILHFNKEKKMVSKVELIEKNGDRTIIELKNTMTNAPLRAEIFAID